MKIGSFPRSSVRSGAPGQRGAVLVIVLWIAFGLVSLALYFGDSMTFEFRASDAQTAGVEAEQAIEGAARYVAYVFTNNVAGGRLPDTNTFLYNGVRVGEATFWLIGRQDAEYPTDLPVCGLIDEASKINLNAPWLTATQLLSLPRMTAELAASIMDWRDTDETVTPGGAESITYARLDSPYLCKNTNFETVAELHLVMGATAEILYGEDANLNGFLEANENDGNASLPYDNADGRLDPGLMEYVTVYSREPNKRSDGVTNQVSLTQPQAVRALLRDVLGATVAGPITVTNRIGPPFFRSPLEFYRKNVSRLTAAQFGQVADALSATTNSYTVGLVNVSTAPAAVLACLPGIDTLETAQSLVTYRRAHLDQLTSVAWVWDSNILDAPSADRLGPCITSRSYQCMADVAAVGHQGRGYRRTRFVFDKSDGTSRVVYRQELSRMGWALGALPQTLTLAKNLR